MHRPRHFLKPEENQICVDQEVIQAQIFSTARRHAGTITDRLTNWQVSRPSYSVLLTCCLRICLWADSTLAELQGLDNTLHLCPESQNSLHDKAIDIDIIFVIHIILNPKHIWILRCEEISQCLVESCQFAERFYFLDQMINSFGEKSRQICG